GGAAHMRAEVIHEALHRVSGFEDGTEMSSEAQGERIGQSARGEIDGLERLWQLERTARSRRRIAQHEENAVAPCIAIKHLLAVFREYAAERAENVDDKRRNLHFRELAETLHVAEEHR